MRTGIEIISDERKRQIDYLGLSLEHDKKYVNGELAMAAATYAMVPKWRQTHGFNKDVPIFFPWDKQFWKPSVNDRIRELAKAGALIAAEIDRLQNTSE